jgi:hypothetical protein
MIGTISSCCQFATFSPRRCTKDREDLRILCDSELLDASTLRERLESAFMWAAKDDDQRDAARANGEIVIDYLEGRQRTI